MMLLGLPPTAPAAAGDVSVAGYLPSDWERPVSGEVLREFEAPPAPWAAGHRGADLAVPGGEEIRAPAHGVVSFSGRVVNRQVLSIEHGSGLVSSFEPVDSELKVGDAVSRGEVLAELGVYEDGSTHCEGQPCVHWGVRLHGEYINPLLLLGELEPSVLLPLPFAPAVMDYH